MDLKVLFLHRSDQTESLDIPGLILNLLRPTIDIWIVGNVGKADHSNVGKADHSNLTVKCTFLDSVNQSAAIDTYADESWPTRERRQR